VTYRAEDGCGNVTVCSFDLTVTDLVPPATICDEFTQVALGADGTAVVFAETFDDGSYDNCCLDSFLVRRMLESPCDQDTLEEVFAPTVEFCCADINDTIQVVFRAIDCAGNYNDCMVQVFVEDKIKPTCDAPDNVTVTCENFDPSLWVYGQAVATDNCCLDTIINTVNYAQFDTVCNRGTITRTFRALDCAGQFSLCTQRVFVTYEQDYFVKFPNDVIVTECDGTGNFGAPVFFGEDCELLGVSFQDEIFTVVPDACFKIERTWQIINWCTYNPNLPLTYVDNPNPNATVNHPSNLPGPTVSACGTPAPWAPTVVRINPTDPQPTNYCIYYTPNSNGYTYKQIIKIIDTEDPVVAGCPDTVVQVCDYTPNDGLLWNDATWFDATIGQHDLCEAPSDLSVTATDSCTGSGVNVHYLLFLDLDGDGVMETVVNSINPPAPGTVNFGNAGNPNFSGGEVRPFDHRAVAANQLYRFDLQNEVTGNSKKVSLRWTTVQSPNTYVVPELPYGTHKIKWIVEDGCGNETVCEYTFTVRDCKPPTVVCFNGLAVNIMPTGMIQLWAVDFLQYGEDNCTPAPQLVYGIRPAGAGSGFPLDGAGQPITSVTFTCDDLGTQPVELWVMDAAGNADFCQTYLLVQDNMAVCNQGDSATVAGVLATEDDFGLEEGEVTLTGSHPALPPIDLFDLSDGQGWYGFPNSIPYTSDYTVTPVKDDNPLNGVTTYDLVLISRHILGLDTLDSPYKIIAADANKSGTVTTFDIVEIRKLILGIYQELPNNTSWRFVDEDFVFPNPINPFATPFPENISVADIQASTWDDDFVGVKIGDVNGTVVPNGLVGTDDRTRGRLLFDLQDRTVQAGEEFTISFTAAEAVLGYQFTLNTGTLEVIDVQGGVEGMSGEHFAVLASEEALTTSWDGRDRAGFSVTFRATKDGRLSEMLGVSSRITKAEAYSLSGERMDVALRFNGQTIAGVGFELYQNEPNPFVSKTAIGFHLPEAAEATLTVYDETGRVLYTQTGDFNQGYNSIVLDKALANYNGLLYYQLESAGNSATRKMIQVKK
jgi:hypothetical protein